MVSIKTSLNHFRLGTLETVAGAADGVRFLPYRTVDGASELLLNMAEKLSLPDRIIPEAFCICWIFLFTAPLMIQVGEVFMTKFKDLLPDYIMTVETKGIPLAFMTARPLIFRWSWCVGIVRLRKVRRSVLIMSQALPGEYRRCPFQNEPCMMGRGCSLLTIS